MFAAPFLTLVALAGALLGVVLAAAVLSVRPATAAHRALGALLFGMATVVGVIPLTHAPGLSHLHRALELYEVTIWLLAGPAFYLYVHLATGGRARTALFLHFLPGAAWLVGLGAALAGGRPVAPPPVVALMIYQALYTALGLQRLVDTWRRDLPAGSHRFWCRAWIVVLAVNHLAQLVRFLFSDVAALREIVPLSGSLGFLVLAFLGIRRSPLAGGRPPRGARAGAGFAPARLAETAARLERAMAEDRLYRDGELTLERLAERLGVPPALVSQTVNERLGCGLIEYLNGHRVRDAQRLLSGASGRRLTVEAIAHRAGFNSRSAFYEAFRRETGTTPSAYRDSAGER